MFYTQYIYVNQGAGSSKSETMAIATLEMVDSHLLAGKHAIQSH